MVSPGFYTSEEHLARQQERARDAYEYQMAHQHHDHSKRDVIDGEFDEVDVSATGDVKLIEKK